MTLALLTLMLAFMGAEYRQGHADRILTGVEIGGVDVGGKTAEEAIAAFNASTPQLSDGQIAFIDPVTGQEWARSYDKLGVQLDESATIAEAMAIGRQGGPLARVKDTFDAWYYGTSVAPVFLFNESKLDETLLNLADEVNEPATNATISYDGDATAFNPGQPGRLLDTADLRARVTQPLAAFNNAEHELLIHEVSPTLYDDSAAAADVQQIL
ncbi:MAG: peptidoglycan binding domain-containing protein, partial [Candidatus Promineifilaceae bacterium]